MTFAPRETPLVPAVAFAIGDAATRLCDALLERSDDALATLRGVAGRAILAVVGAADDLPWVDGIAYAGRDPSAPALVLPTHLAPSVPADVLERALLRAHGDAAGGPPLLVLATPSAPLRVLSLHAARPIARSVLARWRDDGR